MSAERKECPLCRLGNRLRRLAGAAREWRPRPWRLNASATFPFAGGRSLRPAFAADFFSGHTLCEAKYLIATDKRSSDAAAVGLDATAGPVSPKQEDGACASS